MNIDAFDAFLGAVSRHRMSRSAGRFVGLFIWTPLGIWRFFSLTATTTIRTISTKMMSVFTRLTAIITAFFMSTWLTASPFLTISSSVPSSVEFVVQGVVPSPSVDGAYTTVPTRTKSYLAPSGSETNTKVVFETSETVAHKSSEEFSSKTAQENDSEYQPPVFITNTSSLSDSYLLAFLFILTLYASPTVDTQPLFPVPTERRLFSSYKLPARPIPTVSPRTTPSNTPAAAREEQHLAVLDGYDVILRKRPGTSGNILEHRKHNDGPDALSLHAIATVTQQLILVRMPNDQAAPLVHNRPQDLVRVQAAGKTLTVCAVQDCICCHSPAASSASHRPAPAIDPPPATPTFELSSVSSTSPNPTPPWLNSSSPSSLYSDTSSAQVFARLVDVPHARNLVDSDSEDETGQDLGFVDGIYPIATCEPDSSTTSPTFSDTSSAKVFARLAPVHPNAKVSPANIAPEYGSDARAILLTEIVGETPDYRDSEFNFPFILSPPSDTDTNSPITTEASSCILLTTTEPEMTLLAGSPIDPSVPCAATPSPVIGLFAPRHGLVDARSPATSVDLTLGPSPRRLLPSPTPVSKTSQERTGYGTGKIRPSSLAAFHRHWEEVKDLPTPPSP